MLYRKNLYRVNFRSRNIGVALSSQVDIIFKSVVVVVDVGGEAVVVAVMVSPLTYVNVARPPIEGR